MSKHNPKKLHKINSQLQGQFLSACKNANWEEVKRITSNYKFRLNLVVGVEWACYHYNMEMIKYLIDNGANIDDRMFTDFVNTLSNIDIKIYLLCIRTDMAGVRNPLLNYWFAKCNHVEARICIQKGASINKDLIGDYLGIAIKRKNLEMIKLLFENVSDIDVGSLQPDILSLAMEQSDLEMCKKIIKRSSAVCISNCLMIAAKHNNLLIIQFVFELGPINIKLLQVDILSIATENGNLEMCKMLIDKGFDIHIGGENPLIMAIHGGHLDVVKYLVERGADIHVNEEPPDKRNPLIKAIARSHLHIIEYLIDMGINTHITENEPLLVAIMTGNLSVVKYLVEKGANIHLHNEDALIFAIMDGHLDIVKYLVECGADIYANDDEPIARALKGTNIELVEYLLLQGVDLYLGDYKHLGKAIMSSNLIMTKYLFSKGARLLKLSEESGYLGTEILMTIHAGSLDILQFFIQNGADVKFSGGLYIGMARHYNHPKIVELLREYGANELFEIKLLGKTNATELTDEEFLKIHGGWIIHEKIEI